PSPPPLAQLLSCQPARPTLALALTFGPDQLFQFNFSSSNWAPQLPDLPPWPLATETLPELQAEATLCEELLQDLSQAATRVLSEAKGIPVATIFPKEPLTLGEATTLVCSVANIFPPAVAITWHKDGVPVTHGVTTTPYIPTEDLSYTLFSYLVVTPVAGTIYRCSVTRQEDNSTIIAYWVPQTPVATEGLEIALCGAAMALGGLLALVGMAMGVAGRRKVQGRDW
ncbi:DMA protein, partial [Rhinopomastus cyanomelas]|nr:DMA protein [Rhinopomastus cyanomelas]